MKETLFKTDNHWTGMILRLTTGIVLFPHGAQKMLGWFGGYGFSGTMNFFITSVNLPWLVAFMVIVIEFVGAISLIAGFASRVWALLTIVLMLGIIFTSHLSNGFFMNWYGNKPGEGFEYHLLVIGLSMGILVGGSGRFSVDKILLRN